MKSSLSLNFAHLGLLSARLVDMCRQISLVYVYLLVYFPFFFFLRKELFCYEFLLYVHWWFACRYVYVRMSDSGVTDSCQLPCRCWELILGPL